MKKKTYGELEWEQKSKTYKKNEVIYDAVDIKDYGEYDDIVRDPIAREKLNKYNLDFGKSLEPSKEVRIKMSNKDETTVFKALVDDLNEGIRDKWTIEKE
jgi:hypothetical protein